MASRPLVLWLRSHSVGVRLALAYGVGWAAVVVLCYIGLPIEARRGMASDAELQIFGVVGLAGIAAIPAFWLSDMMPWLTNLTARRLSSLRSAWVAALCMLHIAMTLVSVPFLPSGLPIWTGYAAISVLWLGVAIISRSIWGSTAAALVPLGVAIAFTTRIVPWGWNVVFNADLTPLRVVSAVGILTIGATVYSRRGIPSHRD